MESLFCTA